MQLRGGTEWGRRCAQGSTPPLPLASLPAAWRAPMHSPEEAVRAAAPALASGSQRAAAGGRRAPPIRPPPAAEMRSAAPPSRDGGSAPRRHAFFCGERAGIVLGRGGSVTASGRGRRARAPLRWGRGLSPAGGREGGSEQASSVSGAVRLLQRPRAAASSCSHPPPHASARLGPLAVGRRSHHACSPRLRPAPPKRRAGPYSPPRTPPQAASSLLLATAPTHSVSIRGALNSTCHRAPLRTDVTHRSRR